MKTEGCVPLWLEIKTEYIDANLDNVIAYLSKEAFIPDGDLFYEETVRLLERRAKELIDASCITCMEDEKPGCDADNLVFLKILGAYLLIRGKCSGPFQKEAFFFFIKSLITLVPEAYSEDLTEMAIKSIVRRNVISYGFSFANLRDVQPEVLASLVLKGVTFSEDTFDGCWYQNKGSLHVNKGFIEIYQTDRSEALFTRTASSLQLFDETVMVQTVPSERIRDKDFNDIEVMDAFTSMFIRQQEKTVARSTDSRKDYSVGDTMPVRYKGKDSFGNMLVETVSPDYHRIAGQIPYKSQVFRNNYTVGDLVRAMREGDVFDAEYIGGGRDTFSVTKSFLDSLVNNTIETGKEVNAELKSVNAKGLMVWWTEYGYPAYVKPEDADDSYSAGDAAYLLITGRESNGYVYAEIARPSDTPVDEKESRQYCIDGMIYPDDAVFSGDEVNKLSESFVKGFCRLLFAYQKTVVQASERFRILCVCRILSALTSDIKSLEYIKLSGEYLRNLVFFANGMIEQIRPLQGDDGLMALPEVGRRACIVKILQTYGQETDSEFLSNIIHQENGDPILVQLAKLVQSCNRIDDIYPAIKTVIKQEITRFLSVQTEDNTDFEDVAGPNLGIESSSQEFKTSFFFAPANASCQNQEKNIFRSLCSFLNTYEGGVLYLGVNDWGGIDGLSTDIWHLEHKICGTYSGLDGYIRYITDRAKEYFDQEVCICFRIEPAYDERVVVIRVEPYQYGVVEFEGIPYIRNNSESVKMNQALRMQIEKKKKNLYNRNV